ncbi:MAG TPA: prepilin-type N-terminal cleavage/methylation domain-containing protein [Pseudolabrys sp.]
MPQASRSREAGFTIIEALVALAIVAAALAAIGSLIAGSGRGTRALEQHVALVETARAVASVLPARDQLAGGDFSGSLAGHSWRVDVLQFAVDGVDPALPSPWMPQTVVTTVRSPTGAIFQIATVRLHRRPKE